MSVFKDLFANDVGLMSLVVLLVMLGMGAFYVRFFLRHMQEDERRAAQAAAAGKPAAGEDGVRT